MTHTTLKELLDYANCGIIGIDDDLTVFGGYDDRFIEASPLYDDEVDVFDRLFPIERRALADHMIDLWQQYKDKTYG